MPFVCKAEPATTCHARLQHGFPLPRHCFCLRCLAISLRVQSELGDDERFVSCHMLQPAEIGRKGAWLLQKDIERNEVRVSRHQILRGREARIGDRNRRCLCFGDADEFLQEVPHPLRPHPANEGLLDFISHDETRNSRFAGQSPRLTADTLDGVSSRRSIREEIDMLGPWNTTEQLQTMRRCHVQHLSRGRLVESDCIESQLHHAGEVCIQPFITHRCSERPIRDSVEEDPVTLPITKPLPTNPPRPTWSGVIAKVGCRSHARDSDRVFP